MGPEQSGLITFAGDNVVSVFNWLFQIDHRRQAREEARRVARNARPVGIQVNFNHRGDAPATYAGRLAELTQQIERQQQEIGRFYGGTYQRRGLAQSIEEAQKAEKKARALLNEHLTPEQRTSLTKRNSFTVQGSGGIVYRIDSSGGVRTENPAGGAFCVYLMDRSIPRSDQVLGLLLNIKHNEKGFLKEANYGNGNVQMAKLDLAGNVQPPTRPDGFFFNYAPPPAYTPEELRQFTREAAAHGDTVEVRRDYVDVTAFGDVQRTFVVNEGAVYVNGNHVGNTNGPVQFDWTTDTAANPLNQRLGN